MTHSTHNILPVLLAGGSGTRLWPLSREHYPKQFLTLLGERSLLQDTALRAQAIPGALPPLVICNEQHRFIVAEQLRQAGIGNARILLEPTARNTAPAAAVATHFAAREYGPDTQVFLMAADHAIAEQAAFQRAVAAARAAAHGRIVTFGITPTRPETGYGYLQTGRPLGDKLFEVVRFVEKPDASTAQRYLDTGGYYWNGGMFLFDAATFLAELQRLEPEMHRLSGEALAQAQCDLDFVRLATTPFAACRSESIDYAVMEKTDRIALVVLDAGWDDVGSWRFLVDLPADDADGNVLQGDVMVERAHNNRVHASSRLVALVGVSDHIVVETADAVLVTTQHEAQNVKAIVQRLKQAGRKEADDPPRCYRPWGWYETISSGERFQVKRICVNPGHKLSLQMHHHRAEHWVVVRGTARVTCEDTVTLLTENQSTYIPLGHRHRLENPGTIPLEVIEVQSGAYLGEDDIVRFDDLYKRK
ncbi:mannose-1-phosphate guanylyltransferase / mannose-6-phosphate isomerase [Fontimonas thermophila]|uniref:mannose-1-phosphate guanylyltransferase n=1 Tax=Fontimonas thermophila TaxID=1076937 RepID=A0A1I2JK21_9GAMM|nr:mannose-1-phosphate guanylyltransferase/mannose-6-phosphate isomerase [Fontimonas thermophila]SFF54458.1 mannose-1-phosphate guanylyltransferase / mannose-6-phosphate isomerase [Fontimonas thermophila]